MTNNGAGQVANFSNIVYDSGNDLSTGRKRIGISATEIELFDDIPPVSKTEVTDSRSNFEILSSSNDKQKQQNNYQTLSLNRGSTKPNIVYQDENNPQVNSAFDKLIEKYAPDAIPTNLLNGSNNQRQPPQVSSSSANTRDEPVFSTFQTTSPPSSTASHNYSTIIRPNNKQTSQNQTQPNNNNNNNNNTNNVQASSRRQPASAYDSFQHVVPPPQNPQSQQAQFQTSIPARVQNGNFAQVVPGKLYTLDEDPLHLFFDRQNPVLPKQQQTTFNSTFQPSMNLPTGTNPNTVTYTNTTQRNPLQSVPITTNINSTTYPNANGMQQFDLGNLIKRVQQDYLREIQPFVSSVKFVEKDQEYGQSLVDISFTTPVTVRKGFRTQADDILRRSFGRQDRPQPPRDYDDGENTYSESETATDDDDISDLRPSIQRKKLDKKISKESITSVTSVTSTTDSEYGDRYSPKNLKTKKQIHSQGTSPPPQKNPIKTEPRNYSTTAVKAPQKLDESDEEEESKISTLPKSAVKLAKRISSDRTSPDSSDSETSNDKKGSIAEYNNHESTPTSRANASATVSALITNTPVSRAADETARERSKITGAQAIQRSEDIHPTPPTIRPGQTNTQIQPKKSDSNKSDPGSSARDSGASDDDDHSAAYNGQQQASTTSQPNNTRVPATIPGGRGAQTAPTNARDNAGQNPSTTARTTMENTNRQLGSNIHFVPPDQRAAIAQRTGPTSTPSQPATTTSGPAQTGSTRFFQPDNDSKSGAKRTLKDGPASIGDKFKSFFRRK